jgi:hypothetical protein
MLWQIKGFGKGIEKLRIPDGDRLGPLRMPLKGQLQGVLNGGALPGLKFLQILESEALHDLFKIEAIFSL